MTPSSAIWMPIAGSYESVMEIPGAKGHHPQIVAWLSDVLHEGTLTDEIPWCAAYVHGVLKEVGIAGTGRANARSYLSYGTRLRRPRFGCLAVYWRVDIAGPLGHVGFWVDRLGATDWLYSGNERNRVGLGPRPSTQALAYVWPP